MDGWRTEEGLAETGESQRRRRKKEKLHRPLRTTVSGLHGRQGDGRASEMRPGQTRSYKELFPDGLGGEGIKHIKEERSSTGGIERQWEGGPWE